jgi:hypothetical protein
MLRTGLCYELAKGSFRLVDVSLSVALSFQQR